MSSNTNIEFEIEDVDYQSLSPEKKEKFVFKTLSEIVHKNPEGVTRTDILEVTPFGRKTLDKHLERLVALNEAYVRRRGGTDVYYPNGRMLRPNAEWKENISDKTFKLTLIENLRGQSLYLQEIEESEYGEEAKGGLIIPRGDFPQFIGWLDSLQNEVNQFDE